MKKQITILIALVLIFTFALSACGKSKSDKTDEVNSINLPVVDVGGGDSSGNPAVPAAPAQEAYPIEAQQSTFDPAMAYPINPASPTYDSEMEAYLKDLLNALRERGLDLSLPVAFAGGGAELLQQRLTSSDANVIAVLDRFANADGFKALLRV